MPDQDSRDLEKQPPHPSHRKPLIPWGGQFFLKGQKAIVGHHLQKQIRPVGQEIARGEMVNTKAVFHLFDVVFRGAPLIVKMPNILGFPVQVGHDGFVIPEQLPEQSP